jgi:hypothetical protein
VWLSSFANRDTRSADANEQTLSGVKLCSQYLGASDSCHQWKWADLRTELKSPSVQAVIQVSVAGRSLWPRKPLGIDVIALLLDGM